MLENCNSVATGAYKGGKVVSFQPNFDPNFPIFVNSEKGKLYILKKFGLSKFEEIIKICT